MFRFTRHALFACVPRFAFFAFFCTVALSNEAKHGLHAFRGLHSLHFSQRFFVERSETSLAGVMPNRICFPV